MPSSFDRLRTRMPRKEGLILNGPKDEALSNAPYATRSQTAVSWNAAPPIGGAASAPISALMPTPC